MYQKISLICFILSGFLSFAQNSKAIMEINYETKIISDSLNRENAGRYEATLLCNPVESIYFSREAKDYYDVLTGKKQSKTNNVINTSIGGIPRLPKNQKSVHKINGKSIVYSSIGKYIFSFEEPELKWEVLNQTKEIKGFNCRLAKAETDTHDIFFAWYTEDIPIPDGPFRFKNLSGLILEVYNKNKTIEIYATDIKKSDEVIEPISYLDTVKTKNKKQYLEARKTYIDNPSVYNGNIRLFDATGKEITGRIRERLQKINVFLD